MLNFNLAEFKRKIEEIAREADEQRLMIFYEDFVKEYPALAAEIEKCARLPDAQAVLDYLSGKGGAYTLLTLVPHVREAVTKLQPLVRERLKNQPRRRAKHLRS